MVWLQSTHPDLIGARAARGDLGSTRASDLKCRNQSCMVAAGKASLGGTTASADGDEGGVNTDAETDVEPLHVQDLENPNHGGRRREVGDV